NAARTQAGRAWSRSASANTRLGFLPPSSRATRLNNGAAARAMSAPVAVPPVNDRVGTRGWATRGTPTLRPSPWTTLKTPGGRPTSWVISARRWAVVGVSSDGLATQVLPVARAGATFQVNRYSGRFHGEISPATPRGWRRV